MCENGAAGPRRAIRHDGDPTDGYPAFALRLPAWVPPYLARRDSVYPTAEERMGLAIALARLNIEHGTGGPFGAAVFDMERHTLLAAGVNLVVSGKCSVLHAEIVALIFAQQRLGWHDLSAEKNARYELVSSAEPCAMCMGAVPWSGVRSLVCGARDEDVRCAGFDEGAKPQDWVAALTARGISVRRDVCRDVARDVLLDYAAQGGPVYNAGGSRSFPRTE